ncbi:hypothetical protein P691DRAFT_800871, partial [Macrolepiota fuliginosa MF-IS2]
MHPAPTLSTHCPYCRQSQFHSNPTFQQQIPNHLDEILNELERAELLVARLLERRSILRRQLNAIQAPISILPPEILSVVFENACRPPDFVKKHNLALTNDREDMVVSEVPEGSHRTQFALGAVSFNWRQVAFSTPRIWTAVDLGVNPHNVDKSAAILHSFLIHSGLLSLALGFRFYLTGVGAEHKALISPTVDPLLIDNAHRIRELHLSSAPKPWADHMSQFTHLTNLSFRDGSTYAVTPLIISGPCSSLMFHAIRSRPQLQWAAVTVLHLKGVAVHIGLDLLRKCPNLNEFRSQDASNPLPEETIELPCGSFSLPHLKLFEWSVDSECAVDGAMLRHADMPALQKLIWIEQCPRPFVSIDDPRHIFLHRLPSTLSVLDINLATCNESDGPTYECVFDHLRDDLAIEGLRLRKCSYRFLEAVFRRLTPGLTGDDDQTVQRTAFPRLRSMVIIGPSALDWDGFDGSLILPMIESRFSHHFLPHNSDEPFLLEFEHLDILWEYDIKQFLKNRVDSGLKLNLVVDSEPVGWL